MSSKVKKKILQLKESSTLVINEKSKDLISKGKKVYQFGFGQSPFPVPEKIVESLKNHAHRKEYLPIQGLPKLREAIASDDWLVRYWALVACSSFGNKAASLTSVIEQRLQDLEPLVVMRAVEFTAIAGTKDPRPALYRSLQRATSESESLRLLNTAVFLNDHTDGKFPIDVQKINFLFKPKPRSELLRRTEYLAR